MNNKGFTLVELMVSIALIALVLVFMFNLLGDIKRESALSNEDISDALNRSTITRLIQNDFIENNLIKVEACNEEVLCYDFTFQNNNSKRLIVRENEIEYDNERWVLDSGTYTKDGSIYCISNVGTNYYLRILIPVINHMEDKRIHDIEIMRVDKKEIIAEGSNAC